MELDRLYRMAEAADPAPFAASLLRNTGSNRGSALRARGQALAHQVVIPQYGTLTEAVTIAQYGDVGRFAWMIAESWARYGYCKPGERSA